MIVSRLEIENFARFERLTFVPPRAGVIVLAGDNGTGKSALMEAVGFALFGRTVRGLRPTECVFPGALTAKVRVEFALPDGQALGFVERVVQTSGGQTLSGKIGDMEIRGDVTADAQDRVTAALGLHWDIYRGAVHFSPRFSFLGLTDSERKEVLDDLVGLGRFEAARQRAQAEGAKLARDLADLNLQMARARGEAAALAAAAQGALLQTLRAAAGRAEELASLETARRSVLADMPALEAEHAQCSTTRGQLDATWAKLQSARAQKMEEIGDDPGMQLVGLERSHSAAQAELQRLEHDCQHAAAGVCPTCLRPGMDVKRVEYMAQQREAAELLETSSATAAEAVRGAKERWDVAAQAFVRLSELEARCQVARSEVAQRVVRAEEQLRAARARLAHLDAQGAALASAARTALPELEGLARARDGLAAFKQLHAQRAAIAARSVSVRFWGEEGFGKSGLRSYLLEPVLPFLNERMAQGAWELSDGTTRVALTTTSETKTGEVRERIGVRLVNPDGCDKLEGNSTGERARYDIAVMVALNDWARMRSGATLDFLFLDEVFSHIHQSGLQRTAAFLRRIATDRQVFIAAHQPELVNAFEARLDLTKLDGVSGVEGAGVEAPREKAACAGCGDDIVPTPGSRQVGEDQEVPF